MSGVDPANDVARRTRSPTRSPASPGTVNAVTETESSTPAGKAKLQTPIAKSSSEKKKMRTISANPNIIVVNSIRLFKKLPVGIEAAAVTGDVGARSYCYMRAAGCNGRFLCHIKINGPNGVDKKTMNCVITWLDGTGDGATTTKATMKDVAVGHGYYKTVRQLLLGMKLA